MAKSNCRWQCPNEWSEWSQWLAAGLHARNRWRLPVLLTRMVLASGRRTVTTWLRGAGVSDDYQDYYYFLQSVGRKSNSIASQLVGAGTGFCGLLGSSDLDIGFWMCLVGLGVGLGKLV